MKAVVRLCSVVSFALLLSPTLPARAAVPVVFGTSWDGPGNTLQDIVNARYGAGRLDITTNFVGARPGDVDPWFWVGDFSAFLVTEVAGHHSYNQLGWYVETFSRPVIDGVGDGVVFNGADEAGAQALITFDEPQTRFGFYLRPAGPRGWLNCPSGPQYFFTNRYLNDIGPCGNGALHAPFNGDVQALVFDVTALSPTSSGLPTWLVCFEDLDYGMNPGSCCSSTDNDFNDYVFEVTAFGATPAHGLSFGDLKVRYR